MLGTVTAIAASAAIFRVGMHTELRIVEGERSGAAFAGAVRDTVSDIWGGIRTAFGMFVPPGHGKGGAGEADGKDKGSSLDDVVTPEVVEKDYKK